MSAVIDLEKFELTQGQRKILGLREILPFWTILKKTPDLTPEFYYHPVNEEITIYSDVDSIARKAIYRKTSTTANYYECDIDAYIDVAKSVFNHNKFFGDDEFEDFNYHSFEAFCVISSFSSFELNFGTRIISFSKKDVRYRFAVPEMIQTIDDLNQFLKENITSANYFKSNF